MSPLLLGGVLLAACLLAGAGGWLTLRRGHPVVGAVSGLFALLCLSLAALFGTLSLAVEGYHALTREERAATLRTWPTGHKSFEALVELPDGSTRRYAIAGDQVYIDARILKWKAWANLLGLHTVYELDRVGGRYVALRDEREKPHTVFPLGAERSVDAFDLRRRFDWLAPLVDAEYGSATFVAVDRPAVYEVRVSTTGLLVREVDPAHARLGSGS